MKLSANTIDVLKNFATINPSIYIRPGNILATCAPGKSIFAKATVAETFPQPFGIYELNKFLGVFSLFNDYELTFTANPSKIIIKSDNIELNYFGTDPAMIISPPEQELQFPAADVEFDIPQEQLQKIIRAGSVLQLPHIVVKGHEGKVSVTATNLTDTNDSVDEYSVAVGTTDLTFEMVFKSENIIKLISSDYNVKLSSKGISKFTPSSSVIDVYYIATEKQSKFGR